MKGLISLLFLMLFTTGSAQDTLPTATSNQEMQSSQFSASADTAPVSYTFNNLEFRFIPEGLGYRIVRIENGREVDYGSLLQTTDDGYFVLTSMVNDNVSYGRFDESGNFRALRYDDQSDKVVEEDYLKKD